MFWNVKNSENTYSHPTPLGLHHEREGKRERRGTEFEVGTEGGDEGEKKVKKEENMHAMK